MKYLSLLFFLLIDVESFSQILPSLHGVYNTKKIPTNGQIAFFDFSSGESGYTLSGATATTDKNGNSNSAIEVDDATDFVIGSQLGYNESWYGKIDVFGAWNRILTSQEIIDLYNSY